MPDRYDVVIAGAGVAGATAAYFLARSGLKVLIADVKPFERAGDKPCGDAMAKHHFENVGVREPSGEELEGVVKAIDIISPSEEVRYRVTGEGYEVNRVAFTQRLISDARDAGAEYFERTQVRKAIIKGGVLRGAILWSRNRGEWEVSADVLIDATGMSRAILRSLPDDWPIKDPIDPKDLNIAYREIRKLRGGVEEPEVLRIYLSPSKAPGGYWWFFPYSLKEGVVNVGLGVQGGMGHPLPRNLLYERVLVRPEFGGSAIIESGGAAVPTRRPLDTLLWNGIAAVGDAAYTVNPVHGGGKGTAMISAKCVAEAIASAGGDTDNASLWGANRCYMKAYGAKQASLDLLRMFLQKMGEEDLEWVMRKRVVEADDINIMATSGDLEERVVARALRLMMAAIRRPSFMSRLKTLSDYMRELKNHYLNYPETPEGLEEWALRRDRIYEEFRARVL